MLELRAFPGGKRVAKGVADLDASLVTVDSLLVTIAAERLRELGLAIPKAASLFRDAELELYSLLHAELDPYFSYRALLDELDSFIYNFESAARWSMQAAEDRSRGSAVPSVE